MGLLLSDLDRARPDRGRDIPAGDDAGARDAKRRGGAIRKVLLDRLQLDAAVTAWKGTRGPARTEKQGPR